MTVNSTRRMLTLVSLIVLFVAAGTLVWGFTSTGIGSEESTNGPSAPVGKKVSSKSRNTKSANSATAPSVLKNSGRTDFTAIWERPLRRPLFDLPPPPPQVIQKIPPAPIRARLLATMIEPENSTAVLRLASGAVVFRKVGDELGTDEPNVKIAKIDPGSVSVRRGDDETRLVVDGVKSK
jgi:hypothetical protein